MSRGRHGPRAVGSVPADQVSGLIGQCMLVDQPRLRRWWRGIQRGGATADDVSRLESLLLRSSERARTRAADQPAITFPDALPISDRRQDVAAAIDDHQVVVVCGETGSGKSTQLPKICLELGRGRQGLIGHTQPRRIAARAVAARIAAELGEPLGGRVGYKIRFRDRTGEQCRVKLMTDGILLAELQRDRQLRLYDTLIIDEAHERSLNIDFLLGYLKRLIADRRELKVVITSATIDPERLAAHFGSAPVVHVSGRTWPVETRYRPLEEGTDATRGRTQTEGILNAVDELCRETGRGDILVFLAGEREIRETADALRKHHPADTEIVPLYSRLSTTEQDRVFRPSQRRRIVLATNIAETSLTVPGIRYVVDTGRARISRYSYRSKIQQLKIEPISRASAEQRKGRCGRERDGVCIRLFAEEDHEQRPAYTDPEILRTNLASVILQMDTLRLGTIETFPFVDAPDGRLIRDGYRLLQELQAVDGDNQVTDLGRRLARFPVDPRLARIMIAAGERGCLREIAAIAAFLSIQDPRDRPMDKTTEADRQHARWQAPGSDLLGIVKLWDDYLEQRRHLSVRKQRQWCGDGFLSFMRMREWHDVHQQLHGRLREAGLTFNVEPATAESVHRSFVHGFLGHIGHHDEKGEYRAPRGGRFRVSPGSVLAGGAGRWVVAASLVQTHRVYARHVAEIQPAWIEDAAQHVVRRRYDAPRWHRRRGQVVASESVTLYGLVLVGGRTVDFGRIDPVTSRSIFISDALVADELDLQAPFMAHNRAVIARVEDLEARLRRRDLLAAPATIARFFDARVPDGVCSRKTFRGWLRRSGAGRSGRLEMKIEDVLACDPPDFRASDYPEWIDIDGNRFPLTYRHAVGEADDGVTLTIRRSDLGALHRDRLSWLIPGWLPEKVVAMIRALPKSLRRRLVPAPDVARRCLESLTWGQGALSAVLADALQREAGVPVGVDSWDDVELPAHLTINVRVLDDQDRVVGEGRNLCELQQRLRIRGPVGKPAGEDRTRSAPTRSWSFGSLPDTATESRQGRTRRVYVGLHDTGDGVTIGHYASEAEALSAHQRGTLRLFRCACRQQERYLRKELLKMPEIRLATAGGDIADELLESVIRDVFVPPDAAPVRDQKTFESRLADGRPRLIERVNERAVLAAGILESCRQARIRLQDSRRGHGAAEAVADVSKQLDGLVYPGFLLDTPPAWLSELPRYLQAVHSRLDRLASGDSRDPALTAAVAPYQSRYDRVKDGPGVDACKALTTYRWMLEEFRVSLFAQTLGTAVKVSTQRLERQWAAAEQEIRGR